MRPFATTATAIVCTLAVLAVPQVAAAQTSPASRPTEIFGGYSFLSDPSQSVLTATAGDKNLPLGWAAGAARPVWRWVSAVGDISGHYKRGTTLDDDVSLSFHAFAGGVRGSAKIARLTEFAQVLAGVARARGSAFSQTVTTTAFLLQAGGGIDYPLRARLAARLQIDYRRIKGSDDGRATAHQFRAVAALVYR